jgi:hypothetical protein
LDADKAKEVKYLIVEGGCCTGTVFLCEIILNTVWFNYLSISTVGAPPVLTIVFHNSNYLPPAFFCLLKTVLILGGSFVRGTVPSRVSLFLHLLGEKVHWFYGLGRKSLANMCFESR